MLFRQTVVKVPIRHSEDPASTLYFAKLTFSETLPDTSTLPPCPLFVKGLFSAAGSKQVLADAGRCAAMRAAGGNGRDTTPPPRLKAGSAPRGQDAAMRAAGGGGRPDPAEGAKGKRPACAGLFPRTGVITRPAPSAHIHRTTSCSVCQAGGLTTPEAPPPSGRRCSSRR